MLVEDFQVCMNCERDVEDPARGQGIAAHGIYLIMPGIQMIRTMVAARPPVGVSAWWWAHVRWA